MTCREAVGPAPKHDPAVGEFLAWARSLMGSLGLF